MIILDGQARADYVALYLSELDRASDNHRCANDLGLSDCNPEVPCSHHTCGIPA